MLFKDKFITLKKLYNPCITKFFIVLHNTCKKRTNEHRFQVLQYSLYLISDNAWVLVMHLDDLLPFAKDSLAPKVTKHMDRVRYNL